MTNNVLRYYCEVRKMTIREKLKELVLEEHSSRVFIKIVNKNRCLAIIPLKWLSCSNKAELYLDLKFNEFRVEVIDNSNDKMFPFTETVWLFEVE